MTNISNLIVNKSDCTQPISVNGSIFLQPEVIGKKKFVFLKYVTFSLQFVNKNTSLTIEYDQGANHKEECILDVNWFLYQVFGLTLDVSKRSNFER